MKDADTLEKRMRIGERGSYLMALGLAGAILATAPLAHAQPAAAPALTVNVDARDTVHKRITVVETLTVQPGLLTLRYPQWIPGHHAPTGKIAALAGFSIHAGDRTLAWRRDPIDPFTIRTTVPADADRISIAFDLLSALGTTDKDTFSSPQIVQIDWESLLFYPADRAPSELTTQATIVAPPGWHIATALRPLPADESAGIFRFPPTILTTLIDSPAFAARYLQRYVTDSEAAKPVTIDVAADTQEGAQIPPAQVAAFARAFDQVRKLFGSQPYRHYDFLTTQTRRLSGQGTEHQESTIASLPPRYFSDPEAWYTLRHLLVHEYIHAWNGKLHRPAGLATPDYNTPMRGDLLWVYEGLTTYLDKILPVRGGLWTAQDGRDLLAESYATYDTQAGRHWRPLQDTTTQPIIGEAPAWQDWTRGLDYYDEGVLLWLDVDLRIRAATGNRKSLDDFVHSFLGGGDTDRTVRTYEFGDVVAALDAIAPMDWTTFLRARLDAIGLPVPKQELEQAGYRLIYDDRPSPWQDRLAHRNKAVLLDYSWCARIGMDGLVQDVLWDGPAFSAGLLPGDRIVTLDGQPFTVERLRDAVTASATAQRTTVLTVEGADGPRTCV